MGVRGRREEVQSLRRARRVHLHGYAEVGAERAAVGTLLLLPNIVGVVVRGAASPGEVKIVYARAKAGAPKENLVKFLAGDAQPKFVVPASFAPK